MEGDKKRKLENDKRGGARKKTKWTIPGKSQPAGYSKPASIEPGDAGIWVTCELHKEGKCTGELKDLFDEYALKLYNIPPSNKRIANDDQINAEPDIEAEIDDEIQSLRKLKRSGLFQSVRIDIQCVLFFKTQAPIEPVSLVHKICTDALKSANVKRNRWIQRLTPMSRMSKATEKDLNELSYAVLAPVFHQPDSSPKKFAIRTTIRNNSVMKRDDVIKQVADVVGNKHSVDLKNYDLLILVEIYRNICGMSVVGHDYEKLKRFNLAEIYNPTPKLQDEKKSPRISPDTRIRRLT